MKNIQLLLVLIFILILSPISFKNENLKDEILIPEGPSWSKVSSLSGSTSIELFSESNKIYTVAADGYIFVSVDTGSTSSMGVSIAEAT